jgi:hypothetical protein
MRNIFREKNMPTFEQTIIRDFIRQNLVTQEEAKTLPTVGQLRDAYLACARELSRKAVAETRALTVGVDSIKNNAVDVSNIAHRSADFALLAVDLFNHAKHLQLLTKEGREIYEADLRILTDYRNGEEAGIMWDAREGDTPLQEPLNYEELFKHLPERTRLPFVRNDSADTAEAG